LVAPQAPQDVLAIFDCCAIPVRVLLLGQQRKRTVGSNTRRTPGEIAEMDFGRLGTLMPGARQVVRANGGAAVQAAICCKIC
jgi:hypothetical protein